MRQMLLQNATAILLQNATKFISKYVRFLLQNATVLLQNARAITKCELLHIATVHSATGVFL